MLKARALAVGPGNEAASIDGAEREVEALSTEFGAWMQADVDALDDARDEIRTSAETVAAFGTLLDAALALKGESRMLGYPFSSLICASLCDLIEGSPNKTNIPLKLIDHHVDAVKAEFRQDVGQVNEEIANALVQRLRDITSRFLGSTSKQDSDASVAG